MSDLQTPRATVRRLSKRAQYDRATIERILDEALICHVAFPVEGTPVVIPTIHTRVGGLLYFHGSAASRMLRSLRDGVEVSVCVTLVDGLVLARSAFHHSMNYRSVVLFGTAREVTDPGEKSAALTALVEQVVPGRSREVRPPNDVELRQTLLLSLPIEEASAKIRAGGPVDDEKDYSLPVWAGVLPLRLEPLEPVGDQRLRPGLEVPPYLLSYRRPA